MDDDQQIQDWLAGNWREARSGAIWKNIGAYNVAVMPDDRNLDRWKARITERGDQNKENWFNGFSSELDAKQGVLKELLKIRAGL